MITNNKTNSFIVDVRLSLSKICGDMNDDYMERPVSVTKVFKSGSICSYYNEKEKKTQNHPLV